MPDPADRLSARLEFREGTSDKVYKLWMGSAPGGWHVQFAYGRRGANLKQGAKTSFPVSWQAARSVFMALVREKLAKGYRMAEAGGIDPELNELLQTADSQFAEVGERPPITSRREPAKSPDAGLKTMQLDALLRAQAERRQAERDRRMMNAERERQGLLLLRARAERAAQRKPAPAAPEAPRHTLVPGKRRIRLEEE